MERKYKHPQYSLRIPQELKDELTGLAEKKNAVLMLRLLLDFETPYAMMNRMMKY
jgi:hypothetical protein